MQRIEIGDMVNQKEGPRKAGLVTEIFRFGSSNDLHAKVLWRDGFHKLYKLTWLESFRKETS